MNFETLDARIDAAATMCAPGAYYFTVVLKQIFYAQS